MIAIGFYQKNDLMPTQYGDGEKLYLEFARFSDKDRERIQKQGESLPHAVYVNPVLAEAKRRGISLVGTHPVIPIDPICPTEEELSGKDGK